LSFGSARAAACRNGIAAAPFVNWPGQAIRACAAQAVLAISSGDGRWNLINASPDVRQKLERTPASRGDLRGSPIEAGVLAGAEIDEIAGLLSLRESSPFPLYATPGTHGQCHLRRARVARHALCHAADSIPDCNSGPCARPFLISGDARNPDPTCHLSPHHVRIAELAAAHEEGAFT
jgi:phosphoribosyl 1,2-cyclic phosphodiesterase